MIKIKRVYDKVDESDGYRILVDRLWPRGLAKSEAEINDWQKEIAPSEKLRKWYSHDVAKWADFKQRYFEELSKKTDLLRSIREKVSAGSLTFVFAAKDVKHNNAVALKEYIESGMTTNISQPINWKVEKLMLVNIVYFPPIKEGKDEEFRKWFAWSNEKFAKFEGFGGRKLLIPREGGNYVAVVEHESDATFKAMHSSPVHEEALQKVLPLFDGSPKPQFYEVVELEASK